MAFNHSINLTAHVKELPLALRRQVLFSLVGSANAKVVNHALRIAGQLAEYDYKELDARDIELLSKTIDEENTLVETTIISNLAREWRDMLVDCTGDETSGSISGTIVMMTGKQKVRQASSDGLKRLAAIGKDVSPEKRKELLLERLDRDQARADERAKLTGFAEFIIDAIFPATGHEKDGYTDDDEFFTQLTPISKEQFVEKFVKALQTAITKAIDNEITGWVGEGILSSADIVIAEGAIAEVMAEAYPKPLKSMAVKAQPVVTKSKIPSAKFELHELESDELLD